MSKIKVEEDLAALGTTRAQVAKSLTKLKIKGKRQSAGSCPLARYLNSKGHKHLGVAVTYVAREHDGHADIPQACQDFLNSFDDGMYKHLQEEEQTSG